MMSKSLIVIVVVAAALGAACGEVDLRKALLNVPEEERVDFLKYHAKKGYQLATSGAAPDYQMGLSDEFSVAVYRTLSAISSQNNEVHKAQSCIVCWANGKCVDLCDPGIHPV